MMGNVKVMLGVFSMGLFFSILSSEAIMAFDGAAALRRVDEIRALGDDFAFTAHVETDSGDSQTMSVSIKDKSKGLVRFTHPTKVEGRAILFVHESMWVYVPGTRRALRISPQQRVLGGVSSADIARTVYSTDYKVFATLVTDSGIVLKLEPRSKSAAYGQIDLMLGKEGGPQEAVFFDGSRKRELKTMIFDKYKDILGEKRPTQLKIINHVDGESVTIISYSDFRLTDSPDAWYQPSYLPRL